MILGPNIRCQSKIKQLEGASNIMDAAKIRENMFHNMFAKP